MLYRDISILLIHFGNQLKTAAVSPGPEAADHGLGPTSHLHHRHVQHHGRVGHSGVERDSPQDRIRLQPDRPWLPRPQLPGQRPDRAVGPGSRRGQPKGLMTSWAGTQEHYPPCPAFSQRIGTLHDGQTCSWQLFTPHKQKYPAEVVAQEQRKLNKRRGYDQYFDLYNLRSPPCCLLIHASSMLRSCQIFSEGWRM